MHHLQHAVVELDGAGDVAWLADGQECFQIIAARIEVGQREVAGIVMRIDPIGRAGAVGRRRPVLVDRHGDRNDLIRQSIAQFWPRAAVDNARRQVKQQIDDARRFAVEQAGVKLLQLRPDAGQAGERGKQRIEQGGPHAAMLACVEFAAQCRPVQTGG